MYIPWTERGPVLILPQHRMPPSRLSSDSNRSSETTPTGKNHTVPREEAEGRDRFIDRASKGHHPTEIARRKEPFPADLRRAGASVSETAGEDKARNPLIFLFKL